MQSSLSGNRQRLFRAKTKAFSTSTISVAAPLATGNDGVTTTRVACGVAATFPMFCVDDDGQHDARQHDRQQQDSGCLHPGLTVDASGADFGVRRLRLGHCVCESPFILSSTVSVRDSNNKRKTEIMERISRATVIKSAQTSAVVQAQPVTTLNPSICQANGAFSPHDARISVFIKTPKQRRDQMKRAMKQWQD